MAARQAQLQLRRDDVVRRADDVGQIPDDGRVIAQSAEGSKRGHGRPMVAAMVAPCRRPPTTTRATFVWSRTSSRGSDWTLPCRPRPDASFRPLVAAFVALVALAPSVLAADGVTMTVRPLAGGHVRVGAWSAIEVDIANDGPAISGELRLGSDAASSSTYAALVDLPTGSRKRYVLYAQPSIFGRDLGVALVSDAATIASAKVPITTHDPYQSVIGVVAEEPDRWSRPSMPPSLIPGSQRPRSCP